MSSSERNSARSSAGGVGGVPHRVIHIAGVPDFWVRVRHAPHRLLALDYDGTLAPFRVERDIAFPLDGIRPALERIRDLPGTTFAIFSGRPAEQVVELLGNSLRATIYGMHGYEVIFPDGRLERYPLAERQRLGLLKATTHAEKAGYATQLERKSASVALHTRGAPEPDEIEQRFLEWWKPIAQSHRLILTHFDGGVELRALGRDKGTALTDLIARMPAGTLPVYIGDDTTDEDAFRCIKSRGIGIKVGGNGPTEARGRVPDEAAVLAILQDWLHVMAGHQERNSYG